MIRGYTNSKLFTLLISGTLSCVTGNIIPVIILSALGSSVGSNAVAAYQLLMPIYTFMTFLSMLITIGASVMMAAENGEGDIESSNGVVTLSFFTLSVICVLSLFIFLIFGEFIQNCLYNNIDLATKACIVTSYKYIVIYSCIVVPLNTFFSLIILNDGGMKLVSFSCLISIILMVLGVVLFWGNLGGILAAQVVSALVSLAIFISHFFKKKNTIRFSSKFKISQLIKIGKYALPDASNYLFTTIFVLIMNQYLSANFSYEYIAVFGVLQTIILFCSMFFDGIGMAMEPLISIYYHEGNTKGVIKTMNSSLKIAVCEGLLFTFGMLVSQNVLPKLFGFQGEAANILSSAFASLSVGLTFISVILLLISYLNYIDKITFAVFINFLYLLAFPMLFLIIFQNSSFFRNIWFIYPISSISAGILIFVPWFFNAKKKKSHWMMETQKDANVFDFEYLLGTGQWIDISKQITEILENRGYDKKIIMKAQLIIEEHEISLSNIKKDDKKTIFCEATLIITDGITLYIRDSSGICFDKNNTDILNDKMLSFAANQNKILSIGDNRVVYNLIFGKEL